MINAHPLILAAALIALASCAKPATPAPIVAAERAFAAEGYQRGVKASFLATTADDAIMFAPGPVGARETLLAMPDSDPDAARGHLNWWPRWAGIARSGDLGFTTGPYAVDGKRRGYYFTVWKKQPNGAWKWVLDAGVGADPSADEGADSEPSFLPLGARGAETANAAMNEVRENEAALARAAAIDLLGAYSDFLADDARLHDDGAAPALSAEARAAALKARASAITFSYLGGGASQGGDLAWTYGSAIWTAEGLDKSGWYVRVWQKQSDGWRVIFDELIPASA
ncbi:MAG TPA: DUF4440 domain-containing protein [Parvularculaceae bacterium]|nr:DUF4440 domain-containing protein [Parvularculaceae bacterium]